MRPCVVLDQHQHTPTHTTHTAQTHNTQHRTRKVASPVLLTKFPTKGYHLTPEAHQRTPWILHVFSLRSRTTCSRFLQSFSLYLLKLLNSRSPEGHCGGNQPPDGSICLSLLLFTPSLLHNHNHNHTTHNTQRQRHRDTGFTRQTLSMMFG